MSQYEVDINHGDETLIVTASDSLAANETARRQADAEPPMTTNISEVADNE
jgi:hypothetical protein